MPADLAITSTSHNDVLTRMRAILPEIEARADEIEAGSRVPKDLLDRMVEAGGFRMGLDAELGGEQMDVAQACQVIREVARADASAAWHLMVSAGSHVITSRISREALDEFYASGPDTWPKGAYSPKGVAVPVAGGYRLSGRWPLASGAREFDWVSLGFLIKDEGGIRMDGARPDMRVCLVPADDVRVIETWDATGLCGTRSDDLEVKDVFVPEAWQGPFFGSSNLDSPFLQINMPVASGPHHSAIVLGILEGAIADLAESALTKRPAFNPLQLMKDEPVFRSQFGALAIRVDALSALAQEAIRCIDACISERRQPTQLEAGRLTAGVSHIHHEATRILNEVVMLAGSGAVYRSNVLQRRWRDLRCVAQHQAANIGLLGDYGLALVRDAEASLAA